MTIDPFNTATVDAQGNGTSQPSTPGGDPFASATSAFVKMEDLVGRLLLVYPTSSGERASTMRGQEGKMYTFVVTDTHVLDGPVTDKVTPVPTVLDAIQFAGQAVVPQLLPKIGRGMPVLGRLTQKPSQTKGFGDAWVLSDPTDQDKQVARGYMRSAGLWNG